VRNRRSSDKALAFSTLVEQMEKCLIEPHYLGSLEYFIKITSHSEIILETHEHFKKQTFKNRCEFLSSHGKSVLSIPVIYDNRTPIKDVRIDHSQGWQREHLGTFCSAYGKSPFFEFFKDQFELIWKKQHDFLLDLNLEMMTLCLTLLQSNLSISISSEYQQVPDSTILDQRELILPKRNYTGRSIYMPYEYAQVFGNNFVPNLSIVDLLMNEGPNAMMILRKSAKDFN
jgi:hypothetical protein